MRKPPGTATVPTIIGTVVLFAFGFFISYLTRNLLLDETHWSRLVYLYGGVEAIAFAAAGYFFGKEVHRERAEKAEEKAATAEQNSAHEHGEMRAAEEKYANLVTVIEAKRGRKHALSTLADFIDFGQGPNAKLQEAEVNAFIESKGMRPRVLQPDPEWEELAEIAKGFSKRAPVSD